MSAVARMGDSIQGRTTGEHNGHYDHDGDPIHGSGTLNGTITGNCSNFVFVNGKAMATVDSTTTEYDNCDSGRSGKLSAGSSFVFIQYLYRGRLYESAVPRVGDSTSPHNGYAKITTGSPTVFINK